MPIYEFYCAGCHRIYNFLARSIAASGSTPACPRCGRGDMAKRPSRFAISKNRPEKNADDDGMPDLDENRLGRAMDSLAAEMDGVVENDPRQAAHMMRRLFEATGMPVGAGMEEALHRMESGEDPEKIEEELGDAFDEDDPLGGEPAGGRTVRAVRALQRRLRAPEVDPQLYEM